MTLYNTLIGALLLRQQTFLTLRERSDVFLRGFLVLLVVGIAVGFAVGLEGVSRKAVPSVSKAQVLEQIESRLNTGPQMPPALRALIESYVTESVSMVYEIIALTPRGGEFARPIASFLVLVGTTVAVPFSWPWAGWLLFAGLVFHLTSRWLGGRAGIAQMLGLTVLAAAPQIFLVVSSLFTILQTLLGVPLGFLVSLIGFIVAVWSAVLYIKATGVAQGFSWLRALGAIALGYVLMIGSVILLVVMFGLVVSLFAVPLAGTIR